MPENEAAKTTSVTVEIGPPKFQTTIDKRARKALGIESLEEGDRAVLQADLTLKRVTEGDSKGGES